MRGNHVATTGRQRAPRGGPSVVVGQEGDCWTLGRKGLAIGPRVRVGSVAPAPAVALGGGGLQTPVLGRPGQKRGDASEGNGRDDGSQMERVDSASVASYSGDDNSIESTWSSCVSWWTEEGVTRQELTPSKHPGGSAFAFGLRESELRQACWGGGDNCRGSTEGDGSGGTQLLGHHPLVATPDMRRRGPIVARTGIRNCRKPCCRVRA